MLRRVSPKCFVAFVTLLVASDGFAQATFDCTAPSAPDVSGAVVLGNGTP